MEFWAWWVSECYALVEEDALALDWLERAFAKGFQPELRRTLPQNCP